MPNRIDAAPPETYVILTGAELVKVRDLDGTHKNRLIEVRDAATTEGNLGHLVDANFYLFEGVVALRWEGETLGVFAGPDDVVLVHAPDATVEGVIAAYQALVEGDEGP